MTVTAVLVSRDGERWLPGTLAGLAEQTRPPDRFVAADAGSRDATAQLLTAAGADLVVVGGLSPYADSVTAALAAAAPTGDDEWVWLLHDDSRPAPDALERLLAAAEDDPGAAALGPKVREWPSLRRLLEVGLTISGTGRRETGLERGEQDQGQHDRPRTVLAAGTAGLLVRRRTFEQVGGLDPELPVFGNDLDLGWRLAAAGHRTVVVPAAVVFHAEAAHRGVRRTPLTGRHTHYAERRAALWTLLANLPARALPFQVVRLALGTLLRVLGFLAVRSVGEALDELAALVSVLSRPARLRAARRHRREARAAVGAPTGGVDVRHLLAPRWLPYRHGLDAVSGLVGAATLQAADVAERRRAARAEEEARLHGPPRPRRTGPTGADADDDLPEVDPGLLGRLLASPVALLAVVGTVLALVAARGAWGGAGGALAPAPEAVADLWRLHTSATHALGTGSEVPAPAHVLPVSLLAAVVGGPGTAVALLLVLAAPVAAWGAWRVLRVVGHVAHPRGAPRWLLAGASASYALLPATSGAWGAGRLGTVVAVAALPWLAHAALGLADPDHDRRRRAAWRSGLLLALVTAFSPTAWLLALVVTAAALAAVAVLSPSALRGGPDGSARATWGLLTTVLGTPLVLLLPWWLPLLLAGTPEGLLLETGRPPLAAPGTLDLLVGRTDPTAAPALLGGGLALLAVLALVVARTRLVVVLCWALALAALLVAVLLGRVVLDLPAGPVRPGTALPALLVPAALLVAAVVGATGALRGAGPRAVATLAALAAVVLPAAGLGWWLAADDRYGEPEDAGVPAYMLQGSVTGVGQPVGAAPAVLVLRGTVDAGLSWELRRADGTTFGETEVLRLTPRDAAFEEDLRTLVSSPTATTVEALAARGIGYVVQPAPADGRVGAVLDAATGLEQASAEDRSTRAWRVAQPLAQPTAHAGSPLRLTLLLVQGLALLVVLVLCGPTRAGSRGWRDDDDQHDDRMGDREEVATP